MTPDANNERDRGILSPADRQYLRNPEEYSRQNQYERERAIKERVFDSVLDFQLLFELLPEDLRTEVFGRRTGFVGDEGGADLSGMFENRVPAENALRDGVAFLYLAAGDVTVKQSEIVEQGVARAVERSGRYNAEVSLDVDRRERSGWVHQGQKKMQEGEPLENAEIRALMESETVSDETVGEYLRTENKG